MSLELTTAPSFYWAQSKNLPYQNLNQYEIYRWLRYDYDNLYPQKLIRFLDSSVHNAIIQSKQNYTAGKGLTWNEEDDTLNNFLNNINHEYGVNELMKRTAYDLILFGGFSWQIKWNVTGDRVVSIKHIDYSKVRVENPNNDGYSDGYYLSSNWQYGKNYYNMYQPYIPVFVNKFDEYCRIPSEPCIYTFINYNPIIDFYAVPDYHGIINYLEIDLEIANFHLNNVKNGFMPSVIVDMPFTVDETYKADYQRKFESNFMGSDNAGNALINWANSRLQDGTPIYPQITQFQNADNFETFKYIQDETSQQIISGHRLNSPTLAGLSGNGGLGGNGSEIATALEMYMNTIIKGYQETLLDSLKKMLGINGYSQDVAFKFNMPISFVFSEALLPKIMTTNELRKATGLPPVDGGDVLNETAPSGGFGFKSVKKKPPINSNQSKLNL